MEFKHIDCNAIFQRKLLLCFNVIFPKSDLGKLLQMPIYNGFSPLQLAVLEGTLKKIDFIAQKCGIRYSAEDSLKLSCFSGKLDQELKNTLDIINRDIISLEQFKQLLYQRLNSLEVLLAFDFINSLLENVARQIYIKNFGLISDS